jgi:sigma-54 specific flagellar transcriptional regulator A
MTDPSHTIPTVTGECGEGARPTLRLTSQGKIIGQHASIREVIHTVERVASSNCNLLITGESGTGKELVVAALHDASRRARGPVVTVDCATIPEALIEAQLFGHVRGAFTGAVSSSHGFVAAAEGGTLFLDEVGELPMLMQVKLLRLLQQREYIPVGDTKAVRCDIRVVAATNRDLELEIKQARFREDLFYRLNVVHVHLPPLRDRPGDVELLATHFLRTVTARNGRTTPVGFDPRTLRAMLAYPWPGNIRELENAVERAVLLAPGGLVAFNDLPPRVREGQRESTPPTPPSPTLGTIPPAPPPMVSLIQSVPPDSVPPEPMSTSPFAPPVLPDDGVDFACAVEAFENALIRQALERTKGNRNRAAHLLRLNRTTLIEKIRRRGLDV